MKGSAFPRRTVTIAVSVLVFLALVVIGSSVPVPYVALGPGPTVNTLGTHNDEQVVAITGEPTDPVDGNLNLTTVSVTDGLSLFQSIGMWFSGDYTLTPRDRVFGDRTSEETRQENQRLMTSSEYNATAAALQHLNRPTAVEVVEVVKDSPADGVLELRDVILKVDGTAVSRTAEVHDSLRDSRPGDVIPLEIRRGDEVKTIPITLGERPDDGESGFLGITTGVINADPNLKIAYNVGDIGGPSAGLMLTLAVIDKLSPGELNHGKFVAGTGEIDQAGAVGVIGGITHKTKAARDAGATVFLVPEGNCAEAKSDAPDGLELVKVDDLDSALSALDAIGAGRQAPRC